jgi:hypothetical protein
VTQQAALPHPLAGADAGGQAARLRRVLALVEEMAGSAPQPVGDGALDEAARISAAYGCALPIVQRRFDRLAAETTASAAAGMRALLALQDRERPTRAAAARLADELARALDRLGAILDSKASQTRSG